MYWEIVETILLAQTALVVLLSVWGFVFLRWLLPLLRPAEPQARNGKRKEPDTVVLNGNGYSAAWADLRATLQGQKTKELYRADVLALLAGIEQEHCSPDAETVKIARVG